ncbi:oleate hydratase [Corynebacterium sp. BF-R-2]|nr:oleate hydratase [Corynebacterium sp. BF-R-2]
MDEMVATGAKSAPIMMPYATASFMPRHAGERPEILPEGLTNFAFLLLRPPSAASSWGFPC